MPTYIYEMLSYVCLLLTIYRLSVQNFLMAPASQARPTIRHRTAAVPCTSRQRTMYTPHYAILRKTGGSRYNGHVRSNRPHMLYFRFNGVAVFSALFSVCHRRRRAGLFNSESDFFTCFLTFNNSNRRITISEKRCTAAMRSHRCKTRDKCDKI